MHMKQNSKTELIKQRLIVRNTSTTTNSVKPSLKANSRSKQTKGGRHSEATGDCAGCCWLEECSTRLILVEDSLEDVDNGGVLNDSGETTVGIHPLGAAVWWECGSLGIVGRRIVSCGPVDANAINNPELLMAHAVIIGRLMNGKAACVELVVAHFRLGAVTRAKNALRRQNCHCFALLVQIKNSIAKLLIRDLIDHDAERGGDAVQGFKDLLTSKVGGCKDADLLGGIELNGNRGRGDVGGGVAEGRGLHDWDERWVLDDCEIGNRVVLVNNEVCGQAPVLLKHLCGECSHFHAITRKDDTSLAVLGVRSLGEVH
eukprot:m.380335 g.380335  ORF g.380335 m.380335 type:complete len:316 (-) comp56227_c0_seq7:660-1607(-)